MAWEQLSTLANVVMALAALGALVYAHLQIGEGRRAERRADANELWRETLLGFLEKHATDPIVAGAVLGAPGFLSGLNENEVTFVKKRVEKHVSPEIAEARDTTLKAVEEAEKGWQRAIDKIAERAGVTKGPDGTWRDPKVPEPAAA